MKLHLLRPGAQLMRRLRLPVKLGIMALAVFIPLVVISVLLTQRLSDAITFTRAEIDGTELVDRLNGLIDEVQQHRDQTSSRLGGNEEAAASMAPMHGRLQTARSAVATTLGQRPDFALQDDWLSLDRQLASLQETDRLDASVALARHTQAVQALNHFVYSAAERSNLLFDPEPASYFLMDLVVTRLPHWMELISQARVHGAGLLDSEQADRETRSRLRALLDDASAVTDDITYLQGFSRKYGPVNLPGDQTIQAVRAFLAQAETALAQSSGDASMVGFQAAKPAIESIVRYREAIVHELDALLTQRVADTVHQRRITIAAAASGVALVLYLMLSFYASFVADFRIALKAMRETSAGNLRTRIDVRGRDEFADMAGLLQTMNANLSALVASVRSNSALVSYSGKNLAVGNHDLADRTEQQAASLQNTAASVQQLSSTVQQNARTAGQSDEQATRVCALAESGAQTMQAAIIAVEGIQTRARQMNEIIGVIDSLAFQTNILALNAAVEAARAGEQGRGFAVVASEVRTLAQRSATASTEIRGLIEASGQQVGGSVEQIRSAGQTMQQIVDGIRGVATNMSLISTASADQSHGLTGIASAVADLDQITQRNSQMVERAVNQARLLDRRAGELSKAVSAFQLQQGTAEEAVELVQRAQAHRERAGRQSFAADLSNPANGFFDRDMYVFALDSTGTYRAFGGRPDKVGSRVRDIPGVDGEALLRAIVSQADDEPGWVEYGIVNPVSRQIQSKMSYVLKIDDLYVGCGVYKSKATA